MEQIPTKKCPSCHADVPLKAIKCSHCQTDFRNWINRHPVLTFIALIIFVPIMIGSIRADNVTGSGATSTENNQQTIRITDIDSKVTEKNAVWWKHSWIFTINNAGTRDRVMNVEITWLDADGFVLDSSREYDLNVPAGTEKTFSGYQLVDIQVAPKVDGINIQSF